MTPPASSHWPAAGGARGTAGTVVGDEAGGRSGVAVARRSDTGRGPASTNRRLRAAARAVDGEPAHEPGRDDDDHEDRGRADHHAAATRWPTTRI